MSNAEVSQSFAGYDLIGDVHGCCDSLVRLLIKLGYTKRNGVYEFANRRQPRQLIFVGDILDRGPKIREAILLIREMVERGSAQIVMGNHEYNALCYSTIDPKSAGKRYLREHNVSNTRSIQETLEQFANHSQDWLDTLSWLYQWPLFLEFEQFRVIHACWDQPLIDQFRQRYPSAQIDKLFLIESVDSHSLAGRVISKATRGASLLLPDNSVMTGSDGYTRRSFRVKFWVEQPHRYSDVQFQPDPLAKSIANRSISEQEKQTLPFYSRDQRPLFIGHYWQSGIPTPLVDNIVCLDYSAVKNGKLVAYRMKNQQKLSAEDFVWVEGQETLVL